MASDSLTPVETSPRYAALRIDIAAIEANREDGGWVVLAEDVGWTTLVDDQGAPDGLVTEEDVPADSYTDLRLILADAEIDWNFETRSLRIPSGEQTGLKVKEDFCMADGELVDLDVVFDLHRSVRQDGAGELFFHPVIRLDDAPSCTAAGTSDAGA